MSIRLHGGEFIAGRVTEVKPLAAWKAESGSKVGHRKAERVGVKRFYGAGGSDWKFDETDSISHGVPFTVFEPCG